MEQLVNYNQSASSTQYAGFGIRFLAYWVDFLILFPLGLMVQEMVGNSPFAIFQAQSLSDIQKIQGSANSLLGIVISIPLAVAFFLIFWVNYDGATPGKKLLGIKIVKDNGEKLTYSTAFIRYIGFMISAATMFFFGIGYLWIIWDKKKQALHDKIAGTVVVKTDRQPRTVLAVFLTLLAIFLISGYMAAVMFKGFQLGIKQVGNTTINSRPAQSLKENSTNMSPEAKLHYNKSQTLFQQMRVVGNNISAIKPIADQAINEAKLATNAQPNNPILWSNLGDAYTWPNSLGDTETLDNALNAYKKAEAIDPNNVAYINTVGDQLIRMGRNDDAILQFQKTLRLTNSSGYAYLSIGKAYKNLKIYDEARKNFTKAVEVFQGENKNGNHDNDILEAQKELASLPK